MYTVHCATFCLLVFYFVFSLLFAVMLTNRLMLSTRLSAVFSNVAADHENIVSFGHNSDVRLVFVCSIAPNLIIIIELEISNRTLGESIA